MKTCKLEGCNDPRHKGRSLCTKHYREYRKVIDEKYKDRQKHKTCVYYLPEEHYVGMTCRIACRMSKHRAAGKCTDNYEVLAYFEREVDAHYFETLLHLRGYHGYRKA